ncbi:interferon-induced very large GTPase 1-like [Polypterus senegalus]|uniref:interferon-induced very large GTPase 1-like n=1 Tax=Polypterus senegalus TaxID=55291 RepID=UPI001964A9E0|nr:interferon-induced very large GTPase 1-like [Polypterus senegalus]
METNQLNSDQLTCPVCLEFLQDPASLPCGHNYCMKCIQEYWHQTEVYNCPQCRQTFPSIPGLAKNILLANLVESVKQAGLSGSPPDEYAYAVTVRARKENVLESKNENEENPQKQATKRETTWKIKENSEPKKEEKNGFAIKKVTEGAEDDRRNEVMMETNLEQHAGMKDGENDDYMKEKQHECIPEKNGTNKQTENHEQKEMTESKCMTEHGNDQKAIRTESAREMNGKEVKSVKEKEFISLLEKLGLKEPYKKAMCKTDAIVIKQMSLCEIQPKNNKDLPYFYLERLIMMDYRMRYLFCQEIDSSTSNERQKKGEVDLSLDDFFSDNCEDKEEVDTHQSGHIHPMDLQMALLHCSDDFLKQYLYSKLYLCQYALPFLVPDPCSSNIEFPLWAFRQIKIGCKDTNTQSSKVSSVVQTDMPLVSFIRLGSSLVSKSHIMNMVLNRQKHNTFFHRHCKGSRRDNVLIDGMVEIAWFSSGGRKDDVFEDCIAFTNLHGDARQYDKQVNFLLEISAVNVVFISDSGLKEQDKVFLKKFFDSPQPLICLHADKEIIKGSRSGQKFRIGLKNRNEAELTEEIIAILRYCLSISKKTIRIEACSDIAMQHGFVVDEDNKDCREGRALAEAIVCLVKDKSLLERKEAFLPLQGHMWHKWCQEDKELYRLKQKGNKSIEQYRSEIEGRKKRIREEQLWRAFPLNDLMKNLIDILHSHSKPIKMYFLQWLKVFLDELLADSVPELQQQYHKTWLQMQTLQNKLSLPSEISELQSVLDELSNQISDCIFDLKHILREMGQLFEASQTVKTIDGNCIASLPGIASELLISGHPLELMDGDAAHVPVKWICSVLDKVQEKLGDVRLFVLSVLGLQSSGKSTLLNAMFGLQFDVSAGRCTRGAFMQLIKVDDDIQAEIKYDYILVVDTEGLRATELSYKKSLSHDNELATFVMGLGNMTVINIFGENPSEIQDILQISVQAFLRMKQVNLSPSCLFVHQNVEENGAKDKNMEARRRLQEKLDEMTRAAAEEEECNVKCFSDVIRFDVNTQTHYFAHLWEGNPPMAPPNPSYSQNVQDLKRVILNAAVPQESQQIPKVSDFKLRVQDLWTALLSENFVFSFRNSFEISTYHRLEVKYCEWTWALRCYVLELENKLVNEIENNSKTKTEINKEVNQTYNRVKEDIEKYFKHERNLEILVQWKANIEIKYEQLRDQLIEELNRKCQILIQAKKSCKRVDENSTRREQNLLKQSKDLAEKLRTKNPSETVMQEEFEKLWEEWEKETARDFTPPPEVDIAGDIEAILLSHFKRHPYVCDKVQNRKAMEETLDTPSSYNPLELATMFMVYIKQKWNVFNARKPKHTKTKMSKGLLLEDYKQTESITNKITEAVMNYIHEKEKEKVDYSPSHMHGVLSIISNDLEASSSQIPTIQYKEEYRFDLSLHLCEVATLRFTKMHRAFRAANDPLLYLKSMKDTYYKMFKTLCRGASSVTIFVDFLSSKLEAALHQAVLDQVCIDIANEMRQNCLPLKESKINLEYHLLKDMAEKEDFSRFWEYIKAPKYFFKNYIKTCVYNYCMDNKLIKSLSEKRLEELKSVVLTAISKATTTALKSLKNIKNPQKSKLSKWLDVFCEELEKCLKLPRNTLTHMEDEEISDMDLLQESLTKALATSVENISKKFASAALVDLRNAKQQPEDSLFALLSGCWEQCPFCGAICTNSIEGHSGDHSVPFHRPEGVNGGQWYKTDHFVIDICTSSVASDCSIVLSDTHHVPYKQYRKAGPKYERWRIVPDDSELKYWKWFVCRFQKELEDKYQRKFEGRGKIPYQWKQIKKTEIFVEL